MTPWMGLLWPATVACALFAGGAVYVTFVEHPARIACGPPMAVAHFRTRHPLATRFHEPLALLGCVAAVFAWLQGAPQEWLVAGVLLGVAALYTVLVIGPTSRRLRDPQLEPDTPKAERLLRRWGHLQTVPTLLGCLALGLMLARLTVL